VHTSVTSAGQRRPLNSASESDFQDVPSRSPFHNPRPSAMVCDNWSSWHGSTNPQQCTRRETRSKSESAQRLALTRPDDSEPSTWLIVFDNRDDTWRPGQQRRPLAWAVPDEHRVMLARIGRRPWRTALRARDSSPARPSALADPGAQVTEMQHLPNLACARLLLERPVRRIVQVAVIGGSLCARACDAGCSL